MSTDSTYKDYVHDEAHMAQYREYQRKYATKIRESDRKLIALVAAHVGDGHGNTLLDMGCSTGNLLLHLKHAFPALALEGSDLAAEIIASDQRNPELAGITFTVRDMLEMADTPQYDVVTSNAALMFFDDEQFERAVMQLARAVKPGGLFVMFDLFHSFDETIVVTERSAAHPKGLKFALRAWSGVRAALDRAGLVDATFASWHMPFDLPRPPDPADLTSYTIKTDGGERLSFRGALFQPWCHVTARRR